MEKSFIGQEDQMSKLRTEVGANLNSLNYDISGLLQFKNESGKSTILRWYLVQIYRGGRFSFLCLVRKAARLCSILGHSGVGKAESPLMDKIVKKPTQLLTVF